MDSENEEPTLSKNEEPTPNEIQKHDNGDSKRPMGLIIGIIAVVAILIIIAAFLPPFSLGQRLSAGGKEEAVTTTPGAEDMVTSDEDADEASLSVPDEITLSIADGAGNVSVKATSIEEFIQANANAAMPTGTAVQGHVYIVNYEGEAPAGQAMVTIPSGVAPDDLDLYGWNGQSWDFIPSSVNTAEQQITSAEGAHVPHAYALVMLAPTENPEIGASIGPEQELVPELLPLLTKVTIAGLTLADDGTLEGDPEPLPTGAYDQYVSVTNAGAIIDQEGLSDMLNDANAQAEQLSALLSAAVSGDYAGVNLDYQGVSRNDRDAFTQFARTLAETLAQKDMELVITLGAPTRVGDSWNTGGQDWAALGQIAEHVFVQMPAYPEAYLAEGTADQLLAWAVRQIPRNKLIMLLTANAVSGVGEFYQELSNAEALANLGELEFVQGTERVDPETAVEVTFSGSASPFEWDGNSLTYKYTYQDKNGQTHEVWLANAAALASRTSLAKEANLAGLSVNGLGEVADGMGYAAALSSYSTDSSSPTVESAAIAWTVRDSNDSVVASATSEDLSFAWDGSPDAGDYTITADFALGNAITPLGSIKVAVGEVAEETEEEVAEETTEETEPETGLAEGANATVNVASNIRYGPSVTYGIIANGLQAGTKVKVISRNEDSSWLEIITPSGEEAWIYATLLTVDTSVNIANLPVGKALSAPVAPSSSSNGNAGSSSSSAPAPAVSTGAVTNASFELGGQTHSFANPQLMSTAGMNWVKFQHKWGPGGDPGDLAGRINSAHAAGFKVLLSIPGSPYPQSIAFEEYVQFLGGVAALGPDAIEVWNEENIDFEWPAGQIDPTAYVNNMLAPAYNAIKSANPNVMVIGGALAPTGYFGGGCSPNGCDDNAYLAGMAAAGGANYMDCMGVHFNAGATSPSVSSGHPAGTSHYSWYLQPMINTYSVLGKPLCFTELGYLSGEDFGGVPSRFSWAANTTVGQHAAWLAEAVSIAANSGKVRLAIVFNVDFTLWGDDPQAGYAMIRPDGGCPACATLGSVMGR
ncbi:MAG: hypothetical protein CSA11_01990 [Chloroflexi bacterium]|nr:MAG: hypothetical protein CSA11_01990 [Chloroflexota bacterium]